MVMRTKGVDNSGTTGSGRAVAITAGSGWGKTPPPIHRLSRSFSGLLIGAGGVVPAVPTTTTNPTLKSLQNF